MNSFLKIDRHTKSLAGVLAMIATAVVLGAPLSLAEYYAHADSTNRTAADSMANHSLASFPRTS